MRARRVLRSLRAVLDAVVIGSGPNGLAAAVFLARAGAQVLVLEAADEPGGGTRTAELTLPGFRHDVCSAAHPLAVLSPFLSALPLAEHGLVWVRPKLSVAHPLDGAPAGLLSRSVAGTARELEEPRYARVVGPLAAHGRALLEDVLAPLRVPRHPLLLARFGLHGLRAARGFAEAHFRGARARALFAGCAAHAVLPLETPVTAAIGLMFLVSGHLDDWPVAQGGSMAIARALASLLRSLGGRIETGVRVHALSEVPPARVVLFDTDPAQLARVAAAALPPAYLRRLDRFRYGPGVFKIDWALDGPIPWRDPRCLEASTVHVGGTLEEVATAEAEVARGAHPDRPFVLVVQQSQFDPTRAPPGKQTGYAYCHVPSGSTMDMTFAVEAQLERFAPGFRDRILARHATNARAWEAYNPNYLGGAITGGAADLAQLFTRPVARIDPYATPNPRLFLCSASTPPGGGVHGMCGYWAARSAWKRLNS